ncbi:putative quinol monooxygenase [Paenirhodobacter populi]|nr:antibiotic biosynthesis monooxygenase [Sinirhodobacter populi]
MKQDVYWVCVFRIEPDTYHDFQKVVAPLVKATLREEGSLAYEYMISDDLSSVHILEHYKDSQAVIDHVTKVFSQFAEDFTNLATVESFTVYGSPNVAAREILDEFGAVYLLPFDGFTK